MIKKWPYKMIDLTHTLSSHIPTWSGLCGFEQEITLDYQDCDTEVKFRVQKIHLHAGAGTHIDAPLHCFSAGKGVSDLDLNDLIAPCIMIDVSLKAKVGYSISIEDLKAFEEAHGVIPEHSFVIFYTGWDRFWSEPTAYQGNYNYPSMSIAVAQVLLERGVVGIGIDTLSPDKPEEGFPVHRLMLGAGKYIVENIANANKLPPCSSYAMVMPIKIQGGTEAPIRLIALIEEK